MSFTSKSFRASFLTLRNKVAATNGIRTTLSSEPGKRLDFSYLHPEPSEGHNHGHGSHPPPVSYSPKAVFNPRQSIVKTELSSVVNYNQIFKRWYSTQVASDKKKPVAVVLSGSGVHDGSEIQETVSVLIHLSRSGVEAKCYAPDKKQADVINHVKGTASEETRNVLVEAARIARGKVKPLSQLKAEEFSAVVFPGGYGVAKNLCTFAKDGDQCSVEPDVERVIKEFHQAKKPIGLLCVSPIIAAKLIPGVKVTLGNEDKDINDAITRIGAKPQPAAVTDVVVDEANIIVSSPAYMYNTTVHKVYEGVGKLVDTVLTLVKKAEDIPKDDDTPQAHSVAQAAAAPEPSAAAQAPKN